MPQRAETWRKAARATRVHSKVLRRATSFGSKRTEVCVRVGWIPCSSSVDDTCLQRRRGCRTEHCLVTSLGPRKRFRTKSVHPNQSRYSEQKMKQESQKRTVWQMAPTPPRLLLDKSMLGKFAMKATPFSAQFGFGRRSRTRWWMGRAMDKGMAPRCSLCELSKPTASSRTMLLRSSCPADRPRHMSSGG